VDVNNHKSPPECSKEMTFGGCERGLKFIRGEEQPSWSGWRFWKILVNRSTQESMPMTAMPEGKIVCIGGDGGGLNSHNSTSLLISN
jgi:hypothetical protein